MKIPSDKKIVDLYCYVPHKECLPLLAFLREKLPDNVGLEDVVLTETYYPATDGGQESRGTSSLRIGYFISKVSRERQDLEKQISDEEERLVSLEREIQRKRTKLANLKGA